QLCAEIGERTARRSRVCGPPGGRGTDLRERDRAGVREREALGRERRRGLVREAALEDRGRRLGIVGLAEVGPRALAAALAEAPFERLERERGVYLVAASLAEDPADQR